jgi:hypothetical protein
MTEPLRLRVWNDEQTAVPLVFSGPGEVCSVELRCLPGASGVHLVLFDDGAVRLRAEVVADPGEVVPFQIELDEQGVPHVSSRGRHVILLPVTPQYDPLPPIQLLGDDAPLDLAIVVDGTLRSWADKNACLLDHKDLWSAHVDKLMDFTARVVEGRDWRAVVMAFGDQEPPAVTASDLLPRYQLYPPEEDRTLRPLDLERMRERLLTIPSSPGGDYVDALAEALDACVRLHWRPYARKVAVLTGDSPGSSLLHVLPKGSDLCVRRLDVDTQASWLHHQGVEVVTIYHAPPADLGFYRLAPQDDLLRGARSQYLRLASLPELAFEAAAFHPERAAERLERIVGPIARGAALGMPIDPRS